MIYFETLQQSQTSLTDKDPAGPGGGWNTMFPISMGGSGWWFGISRDTHPSCNTPLYWIKLLAMIVGKTMPLCASQAAWAASRFCSLSCALPLAISSCNCCFLPSFTIKVSQAPIFTPKEVTPETSCAFQLPSALAWSNLAQCVDVPQKSHGRRPVWEGNVYKYTCLHMSN